MKASPVLFWTLLAAGLTTADIAAATSSCHDFNADTVGSYNQSHTATFVNGAKIETTTSSPAVIEVATNSGFGPNALWLNGATGSVYEMVFRPTTGKHTVAVTMNVQADAGDIEVEAYYDDGTTAMLLDSQTVFSNTSVPVVFDDLEEEISYLLIHTGSHENWIDNVCFHYF